MTPDRAKAAAELLAFFREAGVEDLVAEEPANHFAEAEFGAPPLSASTGGADVEPAREVADLAGPEGVAPGDAGAPAKRAPSARAPAWAPAPALPVSPELAVMAARDAARNAASLDELRTILASFEGCPLRFMAKQLVFADGDPGARLMLVGEAPGRDEDIEGLPFVGRSGQLLDRMLGAIGLGRRDAYIANIIPWRPPGNRTPTPQETAVCLPFIQRQIELADPEVLVCLGGPAAAGLLATREGIMKTRGRWLPYATGTREIRAMATLHPAYLLRQPLAKRLAWRDFLSIKKALAR